MLKMNRSIKILIAAVLIGAGVFFVYSEFMKKPPVEDELEVMKQGILAPAKIFATDLTEEQKAKFLEQLEEAQKIVVKTDFDNLQSINDVARLKRLFGDFEGARLAWEYANIIRPKNSLSFSNLAAMYHYDLKDYQKAEENYMVSVANDPDDVPTIRNLFELYRYSLKDDVRAEALLLESIEVNPEAPDLTALLAGLYAETGRIEKAVEYYEKHLRQNPQNDAARKELDRLKKELNK